MCRPTIVLYCTRTCADTHPARGVLVLLTALCCCVCATSMRGNGPNDASDGWAATRSRITSMLGPSCDRGAARLHTQSFVVDHPVWIETRMISSPQLTKTCCSTPCAQLTGSAQPEDITKCREAGMGYVLSKPVQMQQLVDTVTSAISGHDALPGT